MKKHPRSYIGILDGSGDVWGVRIPDIDGCVGGGATPEEAIADATQALRDVLAHKQSSGTPFPKASPSTAFFKKKNQQNPKAQSSFPWSSTPAAASAPTSLWTQAYLKPSIPLLFVQVLRGQHLLRVLREEKLEA